MAPSVMPPATASVVLGVNATVGSSTSVEANGTINVHAQLTWVWTGSSWSGYRPHSM